MKNLIVLTDVDVLTDGEAVDKVLNTEAEDFIKTFSPQQYDYANNFEVFFIYFEARIKRMPLSPRERIEHYMRASANLNTVYLQCKKIAYRFLANTLDERIEAKNEAYYYAQKYQCAESGVNQAQKAS